jgi:hypothetical protein
MKLRAKLGYTGAVLTMVAALLTPFVLYGSIAKGRTIQQSAYTIDVHRPVTPHMLQREKPFVQLDWTPVSALPSHVADVVDVDGDGQPDVRVNFDVPTDPRANLHVDVEPLSPRFENVKNAGKERYSRLIVRVDDSILVRVPLAQH